MMELVLDVDSSVTREVPTLGSTKPISVHIAPPRSQSEGSCSPGTKRKRAYKPRLQKTIPFLTKLVQLLQVSRSSVPESSLRMRNG